MTDARHELAATLRGLRQDTPISTTALGELLGWSQSRVSRIERGVALPKPDDVRAWCDAVCADPDVRRHLMDLSDQLTVELTEWRRELAPGRRRKQAEIQELESIASVTRVFSADVIPGLAQTGPYARAMFQLGREGITDEAESIESVAESRLARAAVLENSNQRFELVMSEAALHRRLRSLLTFGEWQEQIGCLIDTAQRTNVTLGVIPFDTDDPSEPHQYHAYAILGDPNADDAAAVLAETVTRGLTIRTPHELDEYVRHFESLISTAVTGDDLVTWLQEVSARDTSD